MLGSSIRRSVELLGPDDADFIFLDRTHADLRDADSVQTVVRTFRPDTVIQTAARVGGIAANIAHPTEFLMDNLLIDSNVLRTSLESEVPNFIYFGSSCMYPRDYRQPLVERDILAAPLEPTNEGYALSKITAAKFCEYASREFGVNYKVLIPSNLYGPGDNYNPESSHLVASTIRKAHEAKTKASPEIEVWGDGLARREFTYVGDIADWVVENLGSLDRWPTYLNLGLGYDYSVREFYEHALAVVNYECSLKFDSSKPVGMKQKLMDSSEALKFGWNPKTELNEGMRKAYEAYLDQIRAVK